MACTDDFIFVLFDAQHLFCVDRLSPDDRAQAKLIWSSNNGERVLALFDRSFHPLGPATPLSDANEHRQVVYGGSSDDDDWKPPMRKVKAARTSSGPRMISSHYVAKE
ncbi:hypothetical protein FOZ60_002833 [Perkinsus olseni]|uniref:Uncharacterized protein n=1 Tax=Perkinsus olseni TaxID=32597 RepID=A0A7J6QP58_PEROL|nr:hypothetical protein FOZ60_002833 [Perkinsus olseni]KAF4710369.1 hypothetical protein FOZ62_005814 [Perkinsus olseni]